MKEKEMEKNILNVISKYNVNVFFVGIKVPDQISTETVVSYDKDYSCQEASKASQILRANLESSLPCARNTTCEVFVEAKGMQ